MATMSDSIQCKCGHPVERHEAKLTQGRRAPEGSTRCGVVIKGKRCPCGSRKEHAMATDTGRIAAQALAAGASPSGALRIARNINAMSSDPAGRTEKLRLRVAEGSLSLRGVVDVLRRLAQEHDELAPALNLLARDIDLEADVMGDVEIMMKSGGIA